MSGILSTCSTGSLGGLPPEFGDHVARKGVQRPAAADHVVVGNGAVRQAHPAADDDVPGTDGLELPHERGVRLDQHATASRQVERVGVVAEHRVARADVQVGGRLDLQFVAQQVVEDEILALLGERAPALVEIGRRDRRRHARQRVAAGAGHVPGRGPAGHAEHGRRRGAGGRPDEEVAAVHQANSTGTRDGMMPFSWASSRKSCTARRLSSV